MVSPGLQGALRSTLSTLRRALGLSAHRQTEDRRVLEQVILPAFARRVDIERVLFVGCAAYTQTYREFFSDREYWTIDPVLNRRRYGSERHIADRLEHLGNHVSDEYFDLIICNGVLGWGLNTASAAEAAFTACHRHLRNGGELMLGWNDIAPRNRVPPDAVAALRHFERRIFDPLGSDRHRVDVPHRHVFDFYRKHGPYPIKSP